MPSTYSPLRYPGGKTRMYGYVKELLKCNDLLGGTYIEPFAGGAGLALKLLMNGDVGRIAINDTDPAIFCFWNSVLCETDDFCEMIQSTPVTVKEWHRQRDIYSDCERDYFRLQAGCSLKFGFAAFYLNRTNVSGIIKGGVIGGLEQKGKYKINARFNKDALIKKIRRIAEYRLRISLTAMGVREYFQVYPPELYKRQFFNFDPPYVVKGAQLYNKTFMEWEHRELCDAISKCKARWVLTYDICPLIDELYKGYRRSYLDMTYSIQRSRKAREYIFFSDNMILPDGIELQEA